MVAPILLAGIPRSGTTLTCHLLNQLPNVVALVEPMQVRAFIGKSTHEIRCLIDEFAKQMIAAAASGRAVISRNLDGRIVGNVSAEQFNDIGLREIIADIGAAKLNRSFDAKISLCIKHPGAFSALLPRLYTHYRMFAIVRNPLATLASWNSCVFPLQTGHVPIAEALDPELSKSLSGVDKVIDRQLRILSWFYRQFESLPRDQIIKYEDIVVSNGRAVERIVPESGRINANLESFNYAERYPSVDVELLRERILAHGGGYWRYYRPSDIMTFGAE